MFLFSTGLVSAEPNGTIHGQPRIDECGKIRDNFYIYFDFLKINEYFLADMPSSMKNTDRIVGGQDAPSPIPGQVYIEGCGATILDSTTLLSAAHCSFIIGEPIRAGSTKKGSGGQVF